MCCRVLLEAGAAKPQMEQNANPSWTVCAQQTCFCCLEVFKQGDREGSESHGSEICTNINLAGQQRQERASGKQSTRSGKACLQSKRGHAVCAESRIKGLGRPADSHIPASFFSISVVTTGVCYASGTVAGFLARLLMIVRLRETDLCTRSTLRVLASQVARRVGSLTAFSVAVSMVSCVLKRADNSHIPLLSRTVSDIRCFVDNAER